MPIRRKGLNLHPDIVDQIIIDNPENEQGKWYTFTQQESIFLYH
jgi:hypothetical protein